MIRRALAALLAFAAAAAVAQAQLRTLPADAVRGKMSHVQGMTVSVDGKAVELAAGAQIRDGENRILVPTALPANSLVKYLLAPDGKIFRAWILTAAEAAQPDPKK
jgi:hypothetical protein